MLSGDLRALGPGCPTHPAAWVHFRKVIRSHHSGSSGPDLLLHLPGAHSVLATLHINSEPLLGHSCCPTVHFRLHTAAPLHAPLQAPAQTPQPQRSRPLGNGPSPPPSWILGTTCDLWGPSLVCLNDPVSRGELWESRCRPLLHPVPGAGPAQNQHRLPTG